MSEPSRSAKRPGRAADLRLLPWPSLEGKPCYLSSGVEGGRVTRLADMVEDEQLASGAETLGQARKVLEDPMSPYTAVRYAAIRVTECLGDVLRVAESRGLRLAAPDTGNDGEDDIGGEEVADVPEGGVVSR